MDDEMVDELHFMLEKYGITDKNEINHFLAQCYVESWFGKSTVEINWSAPYCTDERINMDYFNKNTYIVKK